MVQKTSKKGNSVSKLPTGGAVMRISLLVSLLFHMCVLLTIQKAFPMNWLTRPLRTYHVELLRPPVDPLNEEEAGGTDLAKIKPQEKTPPQETEDTISLDTQDKRYSSYAKIIKERLNHHWSYPHEALENLIEGKVLVLFSLDRQGNLKGIKIMEPSAYKILEEEAIRAIRAASPFPPFPGSVTVTRLNIKANFVYQLTTRQ